MGLFEINDTTIRDLYHRAELESNRGSVNTRNFDYLDKSLLCYAREHNCSYDEALIFAKTGKKIGRLAKFN